MRVLNRLAVCLGLSVICGFAQRASAVVLFDSHGFEASAGYNSNSGAGAFLVGQPASAPASDRWLQQVGGTTAPFAAVYNYAGATPANGQFAAIGDFGITTDSVGYFYPAKNTAAYNPYTPVAGQGVAVQFTMTVTSTSGAGAATGNPFFGVQAFGVNSVGATVPIAQIGINGTTGGIRGVGTPNQAFTATPGVYYFYELLMDFNAQQYYLYAAPTTSATPAYTLIGSNSFANQANAFSDGRLASFTLGTTTASGYAYIDDYIVQTAAVPEPASVAVLGVVSGLLVQRRRRASVQVG